MDYYCIYYFYRLLVTSGTGLLAAHIKVNHAGFLPVFIGSGFSSWHAPLYLLVQLPPRALTHTHSLHLLLRTSKMYASDTHNVI